MSTTSTSLREDLLIRIRESMLLSDEQKQDIFGSLGNADEETIEMLRTLLIRESDYIIDALTRLVGADDTGVMIPGILRMVQNGFREKESREQIQEHREVSREIDSISNT